MHRPYFVLFSFFFLSLLLKFKSRADRNIPVSTCTWSGALLLLQDWQAVLRELKVGKWVCKAQPCGHELSTHQHSQGWSNLRKQIPENLVMSFGSARCRRTHKIPISNSGHGDFLSRIFFLSKLVLVSTECLISSVSASGAYYSNCLCIKALHLRRTHLKA